jgi:CelD/BcsL family acetyltransferase involved in cellulose biosynthesis
MGLMVREARSFRDLAQEWEVLMQSCSLRTPFTHPTWCELWWQHFAERHLLVGDELRLLEVRDRAGVLKAVAPFVATTRPSLSWLGIRSLRLIGADPAVTELSTLVCAPEDEAFVVAALLNYLLERRSEWDMLSLGDIRADSDSARILGQFQGLKWTGEVSDFVLTLPADWETFKSSLKRNIKESLRKCYNAPKRDGLTPEFRVRSTPAEITEALERWFKLHTMRAEFTETVEHRNVFAVDPPRAFLRGVVAEFAARGLVRIFELELQGQVVASRIGFVLGNTLYLYFSGYDPAFRQYSVMTTTVAEVLKWAIAQGLKSVNLSPGNDVSKTRWSPTEIKYHKAVLPSPSLRGLVFHQIAHVATTVPAAASLLSFARRQSHRALAKPEGAGV